MGMSAVGACVRAGPAVGVHVDRWAGADSVDGELRSVEVDDV